MHTAYTHIMHSMTTNQLTVYTKDAYIDYLRPIYWFFFYLYFLSVASFFLSFSYSISSCRSYHYLCEREAERKEPNAVAMWKKNCISYMISIIEEFETINSLLRLPVLMSRYSLDCQFKRIENTYISNACGSMDIATFFSLLKQWTITIR